MAFTALKNAIRTTKLSAPQRRITTKAHDISDSISEPSTHYKITLTRSAIGLPERIKGTLHALGIHRRMQTVYHPYSPECAGKILAVKELVAVENVPASAVRSKNQQREERKATRGFAVVGGLKDREFG